jgi:hypothetical protein
MVLDKTAMSALFISLPFLLKDTVSPYIKCVRELLNLDETYVSR